MLIHRNRGRNAQAVSLGLLATAFMGLAAAAAPDAFVLVAYSNRTGGAQIAQGEYASAAQARRSGLQSDPGALDTNRCVALAMSEQLAQAQRACDSAVRAAVWEQAQLPSWNPASRNMASNAQAVAYSNRAVLRWLSADRRGAQEDLARARTLAPQATFVARNQNAILSHQNAGPASTASLVKATE